MVLCHSDGFPTVLEAFLTAALGHLGFFFTVSFSEVFDLQHEALSKLGFYTWARREREKSFQKESNLLCHLVLFPPMVPQDTCVQVEALFLCA